MQASPERYRIRPGDPSTTAPKISQIMVLFEIPAQPDRSS
jgi:hypothetical protein